MRALYLENQSLHLCNDSVIPQPAADEALVKVHIAGICATDLQLCQGYYPFNGILGHEFVGEIVTPVERAGERVVGEINLGCGECELCQQGMSNHCVQRRVLGIKNYPGAFAEYLCLPLANLCSVPDSVTDTQAVFTEPLAAALQIAQQLELKPQHKVLVIGAGKLGQLIAQVLRLSAVELSVCARYPQQRALLERLKIPCLFEQNLSQRHWDIVIEATGSPSGLNLALDVVRPRGSIVLKSTFGGMVNVPLSRIVVEEICLQGSRCGAFIPALRLLEQNLVHPEWLITHTLPLDQGRHAFDLARQKGAGKILLQMPLTCDA